jgi:uncharacterized Ntn-hydrolase superfamily protein
MTYSIIARDSRTGEMGVACETQAFAVGSSVPWAQPGYGVIATQSMGEPMYGELGLDQLRSGLTAEEALTALRSVDPHPERRQVAMLDADGDLAVYTGEGCVAEAGHAIGEDCSAQANMVTGPAVWESMVEAYMGSRDSLPNRLMRALEAGEAAGGDFRGKRSAAIIVVRARRTGRPWRDQLVDLRVDDHPEPVAELDRLVRKSEVYHQAIGAFEQALNGQAAEGAEALDALDPAALDEPDLLLWKALTLAYAERDAEAAALLRDLQDRAPQFIEAARRFGPAGLMPDAQVLERVLPEG